MQTLDVPIKPILEALRRSRGFVTAPGRVLWRERRVDRAHARYQQARRWDFAIAPRIPLDRDFFPCALLPGLLGIQLLSIEDDLPHFPVTELCQLPFPEHCATRTALSSIKALLPGTGGDTEPLLQMQAVVVVYGCRSPVTSRSSVGAHFGTHGCMPGSEKVRRRRAAAQQGWRREPALPSVNSARDGGGMVQCG